MPAQTRSWQCPPETIGEVYSIIGETSGQRVTFEVVDRDERLAGAPSDPLRHHRADNQTADKTGAGGSGYSVDLGQRDIGFGERAVDHSIEMIEMRPRGNLRYDTTKRRMFDELRPKLIGHYPRTTLRGRGNNCRGGLVAAGFNAEDDHLAEPAKLVNTTSGRYAAAFAISRVVLPRRS